jgi:hypothetical protein
MNIPALGWPLTALLLTAACRDQPARMAVEHPRPFDTVEAPVAAPAALPAAPKRVCSVTDDAAANDPFGAELTVADITRSGGRITSRKPVRNAHVPKQTDTLITVQQAGNEFVFYRSPEKDLLSSATLVSFTGPHGQALRNRISAAYRRQGSGCDSLLIADEMQMNRVLASVSGGKVRQVRVEPYLD